MPDKKISELNPITDAAGNDLVAIVDASDPSETKHMSVQNLLKALVLNTVEIIAVSPITGGGDLTQSRNIALDITGQTEVATTETSEILYYDPVGDAFHKTTKAELLSGITGGLNYLGAWDASTNTPTIADATGSSNDRYVVSIAGTQDLGSGPITFAVGDSVIHNGNVWQKFAGGGLVTSVFGRNGAITAQFGDYTSDQIDDSVDTNKFATQAELDQIATNSSDISTLQTDKADKSNVLELDNTDPFTPDADYEPATKKYVDDNAGGGGISEELAIAYAVAL